MTRSEVLRIAEEIQDCNFCKRGIYEDEKQDVRKTPLIFVGERPRILVVSDGPPVTAWNGNLGKDWKQNISNFEDTKGTGHRLCNFLNVDSKEFTKSMIWIQRRNCWIRHGRDFSYQHCSGLFLDRIIHAADPKIILTLGGIASSYFMRYDDFSKMVGKQTYSFNQKDYDLWVLYHPSIRWPDIINSQPYNDSYKMAGKEVLEVIQSE